MNEDAKLNDFLKKRLEADVPGEPPRLDAILHAASAAARRRSVRLWVGLLAAASLAVLCLFAVHFRNSSSSAPLPFRPSVSSAPAPSSSPASVPSPEQTVVGAIDLLSTFDGDELDVETNSVVEVLLAWQDAPYEDAVADLFEGK